MDGKIRTMWSTVRIWQNKKTFAPERCEEEKQSGWKKLQLLETTDERQKMENIIRGSSYIVMQTQNKSDDTALFLYPGASGLLRPHIRVLIRYFSPPPVTDERLNDRGAVTSVCCFAPSGLQDVSLLPDQTRSEQDAAIVLAPPTCCLLSYYYHPPLPPSGGCQTVCVLLCMCEHTN